MAQNRSNFNFSDKVAIVTGGSTGIPRHQHGRVERKVSLNLKIASLVRLKSIRPVDAGGRILIKQAGRKKYLILRQTKAQCRHR
jgi:hypothetical protein